MKLFKFFTLFFTFFILTACGNKTTEIPETNLSTPLNLDYANNTISWEIVDNAEKYILEIGGENPVEVSGTTYSYSSNGNSFNFRIKAVASEFIEGSSIKYLDSEYSERTYVSYLAQVTNFVVRDGKLHWDAVEDADGYVMRINGIEQEMITTNYFDGFTPGQSSTVFVKAARLDNDNNIYISEYSNETVVTLLPSPILQFDNASKTIFWNAINGAQGYVLEISYNDEVILSETLGLDTTSRVYEFLNPGDYFIKAKSTADDDGVIDSKFSESISVHRLDNPQNFTVSQGTGTYISNVLFDDVELAKAFEVKVDGVIINLTTRNSFEFTFPISDNEVISTFSVTSKGDNKFILDAKEEKLFELTKLATPTNITINDTIVTWSNVNKNSGYVVNLDGQEYIVTSNVFELDQLTAGNHIIKIRTRGNGSYYVGSNYSTNYDFTKLNAPTNLSISNKTLTWSSISGATSYKIQIGDLPTTYATNNSYSLNDSDITASTDIKVSAVGNGGNILDSNYSNTVIAYRLNTPTSLGVNNDFVFWNWL